MSKKELRCKKYGGIPFLRHPCRLPFGHKGPHDCRPWLAPCVVGYGPDWAVVQQARRTEQLRELPPEERLRLLSRRF